MPLLFNFLSIRKKFCDQILIYKYRSTFIRNLGSVRVFTFSFFSIQSLNFLTHSLTSALFYLFDLSLSFTFSYSGLPAIFKVLTGGKNHSFCLQKVNNNFTKICFSVLEDTHTERLFNLKQLHLLNLQLNIFLIFEEFVKFFYSNLSFLNFQAILIQNYATTSTWNFKSF